MTKLELIHAIASRTGLKLTTVKEVLDVLAVVVQNSMLRGVSIKLPGLVKFEPVDKPACTRRNPRNGATIHVPAHKDVKTVTAKSLRKSVADY